MTNQYYSLTMSTVITVAVMFVFFFLFYKFSQLLAYTRKFRDFPQLENSNLILGDLGKFFSYKGTFYELCKEYTTKVRKEGWIVTWLTWYPIVFCYSPEVNQKILNKKTLNRSWISKFVMDGVDGIIVSNLSKWHHRRSMIARSYSPKVVQSFVPTILRHTNDLMANLRENKKPVEFFSAMYNVSLNILMDTSMGLVDTPLAHLRPVIYLSLHKWFDWMVKTPYNPILWNSTTASIYKFVFNIDNGLDTLKKCCFEIIKARIEARLQSPIHDEGEFVIGKKKAFLDHLVDAFIYEKSSKTNHKIDIYGIMEELISFSIAGTETVSTAITWALHCLGNNLEIQEQLFEELQANLPLDCSELTIDDLDDLPFLDQVCKETLRLRPSVPWIPRVLADDVTVNGCTIPKNAFAIISTYYAHRNTDVFPSPKTFDPSRFSPENAAKIPPGAYIPFGDGPRKCIGYKVGMITMKMVLANLLRNFKVLALDPMDAKYDVVITLRPKMPFQFKFIERDQQQVDIRLGVF